MLASEITTSQASTRGASGQVSMTPVLVSLINNLDDNINVLRTWDQESLLEQLSSGQSSFSIYTNSRDHTSGDSRTLLRSICSAIQNAATQAGRAYQIVLRDETALKSLLEEPVTFAVGGDDATEGTSRKSTTHPMGYQRLGSSGLKVSRLILGCMTFGNPEWEGSPWVMPEKEALPLLKKAYDNGINTWETANTYSNGWSEAIIGKALTEYNIPRSKVVIMTKLYYPVLEDEPNARPQPAVNAGKLVNQMGLSRKHIFEAVEGSLRRLNTSYIDVLSLHRLDSDTSPEEIMRALHDLVKMGKVHYIGASSMHCWQFARLQYIAKMNKWTTFTCMSGLYNLLYREEEREMNPFCEAEGVGLVPWSPIARGLLTRPYSQETERSQQDVKAKKWFQGDQDREIVDRVERIAKAKGCSMSSVALAWVLHRGACPIVGLNSIARIDSASEALGVHLTVADMAELEELYQPLQVQAI